MTESTATVEELLAKQSLSELTFRVARAVDRNDVDLFCSCFHEGAQFDAGMVKGAMPAVGREMFAAIGDSMRRTQHVVTNQSFIVGGAEAKGESYVTGTAFFDQDGQETELVFGGRYLDRYERRDGSWKIAERRIVVDYTRVQPSTHTNEGAYEATSFKGTKDRSDPLYSFLGS